MWNVKKSHRTRHAVETSGLACTLNELLPLCAFEVHVLVIRKILFTELSDLLNADIFHSSITLMKNYHKLHQKNLSVLGNCHTLGFSKFQILFKSLNFITGKKYSELFFLTQQINFIHFQYDVCQKLSHGLSPVILSFFFFGTVSANVSSEKGK